MIARRHLRLLIALLLPLMVVRGMLPAGYMPVAEPGGIRMALCSEGLHGPAETGGSNHHRLPGGGGECLFAHAGPSAPPPAAIAPASTGFSSALAVASRAEQRPTSVLPRAQWSRGPPAQ